MKHIHENKCTDPFATANTLLCSLRFEPAEYISMHVEQKKGVYTIFL